MHEKSLRLTPSSRFQLSPRGDAAGAAYRAAVRAGQPAGGRTSFETARTRWAACHGLAADDGAYFSELATGSATLRELGEALAVCGQSREAVREVVGRLLQTGFLDQVTKRSSQEQAPALEKATTELTTACVELEMQKDLQSASASGDRSHMGSPLHRAFFRVVAARRFLDSLRPSG